MPVVVDVYLTHDEKVEKIDSSLVRVLTSDYGNLGVAIHGIIPDPFSRLKIVVKKDDKEFIFEFDITQKAYKSRHSKNWLRFILF